MTISETGKRHAPRSGFTLLEMVLTIGIIVLMVGALVPLFSGSSESRMLQNFSEDFSLLAREARLEAMKRGYPTALVLDKSGVSLRIPEVHQSEDPFAEEVPDQSLALPAGGTMAWRGWRATEFQKIADPHMWIFQPNGLCEPITVRIANTESWIELTFSALTAEVTEESYALN